MNVRPTLFVLYFKGLSPNQLDLELAYKEPKTLNQPNTLTLISLSENIGS